MNLHEQLVAKLVQLSPGAHWLLSGDTYAGLVWLDDQATKPTAEDLGL